MENIFERLLKKATQAEKKKPKPKSKNYQPYNYYSKTEVDDEYWDEYLKEYYKEDE